MAKVGKALLALEEKFWNGDSAFYGANADKQCLVAFAEMSGLMKNKDLAKTAGEGHRWKNLAIHPKGMVEPTDDVRIFTYEARADRAEGGKYAALVSSGYVKRDGKWKMFFHSQTPLDGK